MDSQLPHEKGLLDELLDLLSAPRWRVEYRDGKPYFMDVVRRRLAQTRRGEGTLKVRAAGAWFGFLFEDAGAVDAFLAWLFSSWASFSEEKRSALREALFVVLKEHYRRLAREIYTDPPPWLDPKSRNPKG